MNENNLQRCRTCYEESKTFQPLDGNSVKYPQKTLADFLLFIAKVDTKIQHFKELPQHLCANCVLQLENAYAFARKAQEVNQRLLASIGREDCLTEAPIDIPLDNNGDIRSIKQEKDCEEVNFEEHYNDQKVVMDNNTSFEGKYQVKKIMEKEFTTNSESEMETDPITVELQWDASEEEEEDVEGEETDDTEINENKKKTVKRTVTRSLKSARALKTIKKERKSIGERFMCEICSKTFAWRKDMQRHALTHNATPEYECSVCGRQFLRKDKLKDHQRVHEKHKTLPTKAMSTIDLEFTKRLYAITPFTQIQCTLCFSEFSKTNELKEHLLQHADLSSLQNLPLASELMQQLLTEHGNCLETVKDAICAKIKALQLSRYYSITNEFGYEVNLSDCEMEKKVENLNCELCQLDFKNKYEFFEHVQQAHANAPLPYKCALCHLQFASDKLFQHHLRTQCRNKEKQHQCSQCNIKFMWQQNLEKHQCQPVQFTSVQLQPCIECYLCNQSLPNLILLRTHLQQHAEGLCSINLCKSKYFEHNLQQFGMESEEKIINYIQSELQAQNNMHRFFNASDGNGKELYLSDSETDVDNVENFTIGGVFKCALCPWRAADVRRKHLLQHQLAIHCSTPLPFECSNCHIQFVANELLEQHKKRVCNMQADRKFICAHCDTQFFWQINLDKHMVQCSYLNATSQQPATSVIDSNKKLQCEHCGKEFNWAKDLTRHKRIHLPDDEKIACPICDRKFARKDNMQAHMKVHGGAALDQNIQRKYTKKAKVLLKDEPQKKFECIPCGRTFMLLRDLTRHNVMHNRDAAIHECLWCARKFFRLENLQMHIRRHDVTPKQWEGARCLVQYTCQQFGVKYMQCKLCNSSDFRNVASLRQHMQQEMLVKDMNEHVQLHTHYSIANDLGYELNIDESETEEGESVEQITEKPHYACEICHISFRRKFQVMNHQLALHKWEKLPHKCERCVFRTVCKDILYQHMQTQCFNTQKKYGCELCYHRFMWPENLELHKEKIHANQLGENSKTETNETDEFAVDGKVKDEQLFECTDCGDTFNRQDRLRMHVLKKHEQKKETTKKEEKKYLCAFCGRALSSSSNLIIHMRRHTGEKPFKCEFCDKAFPRSSDMMCHRRTHTGERPHKCTVCNKAFSRSYKLQTHMRIHSGERPYKCTFCEKSFTQSNDLVLHIRRHTGERPYVCGICGERFIQSTALRNHRTMRGHFEANEPRRGNFLEKFDLV